MPPLVSLNVGQLRRDGLGENIKPQLQQRMDELAIQRTKETNGEPLQICEIYHGSVDNIPDDLSYNVSRDNRLLRHS